MKVNKKIIIKNMMHKKDISKIELLAGNAWQPETQQDLAGWRLRYSRGITRRGNSVLPLLDDGEINLAKKIAFAENFYSEKILPTVFQMTEAAKPARLYKHLKTKGYQDRFHTQVQTAPTKTVLKQSAGKSCFEVSTETEITDEWFSFYTYNNQYGNLSSEVRENILRKIPGKSAFISLKEGGKIVSIGLGVVENKYMGIYCMYSSKNHRRRGAATQTIHALADWAINNSANHIYLQVMEDNQPALAFYSTAGFTKQYRYWYSEKSFAD